ncbi:surfeit locus protein 2-like [Carcharodon carcharias]|uniref:surfeit locus protein 2-like n=1 Tax=Carcharodon carcharias TaxID=13397 RepID=UPI001B7E173E|nr:surfeit locus protein 2-like [Carcharodon carcharias]
MNNMTHPHTSNVFSIYLDSVNECTALGVPFVPACLSQKKKRNRESNREEPYHNQKTFWAPDESEGSESDNSDDSMSDLYPEHLFSRKDDSRTELLLNKGIVTVRRWRSRHNCQGNGKRHIHTHLQRRN